MVLLLQPLFAAALLPFPEINELRAYSEIRGKKIRDSKLHLDGTARVRAPHRHRDAASVWALIREPGRRDVSSEAESDIWLLTPPRSPHTQCPECLPAAGEGSWSSWPLPPRCALSVWHLVRDTLAHSPRNGLEPEGLGASHGQMGDVEGVLLLGALVGLTVVMMLCFARRMLSCCRYFLKSYIRNVPQEVS